MDYMVIGPDWSKRVGSQITPSSARMSSWPPRQVSGRGQPTDADVAVLSAGATTAPVMRYAILSPAVLVLGSRSFSNLPTMF